MVDRIKRIECCLREVRNGAGYPPEQDDALLVGDRSDGVDELRRRLLSKIPGEERRTSLYPMRPRAHAAAIRTGR